MFCIFNLRKSKALIQATVFVTHIHCRPNLNDEKWKLEPQLRAGAETVWKYLSDLQKCCDSYPESVFQSVAFALERIGFDVTCIRWLFMKVPRVEEVCQLLANNVSLPLVQFVEKLQRCRCRPDWVFLGAVNTADKDLQYTEDRCCARKREKRWGKQQSVNPSEWSESGRPPTLC